MKTTLIQTETNLFHVSPVRGALVSQGPSESNDILIQFFKHRNIEVDCFHVLEDILVPEKRKVVSVRLKQSFSISAYTFFYGRTWGDPTARDRLHSWQRIFSMMSVPSLDPLTGVQNNDDKIRMTEVLNRADVSVPKTIVVPSGADITDSIRRVRAQFFGDIVVKANGSGGKHVHFTSAVRNADGLVTIIRRYCYNGILIEPLVIQQYVPSKDDQGRSYHYRALLIDGRLYAVMKFTAADKETLASNIAKGGSAEAVPANAFPAEDHLMLSRAASEVAINIAGVDFLKPPGRPVLILEVNNSPGLNTAYQLGITQHLDAIVGFAILTATSGNAKYQLSKNSFDPCWKCDR